MAANVCEYCNDYYRTSHIPGFQIDPEGPSQAEDRVGKSGSHAMVAKLMSSSFDTLIIAEGNLYHFFIREADENKLAKRLLVKDNGGGIRKDSASFQTYALHDEFVDGICKLAFITSSVTDPVTQGDVATIHANAPMAAAVIAQLGAACAGSHLLNTSVANATSGYSQLFDEIVANWSTIAGPGFPRLTDIFTKSTTLLHDGGVKDRLTLVNRGTVTTGSIKNSTTKPNDECVAFYDGYSRVLLKLDGPSYTTGQKTATGICIRVPENVHLFTYDPVDGSFDECIDGRVNHAVVVRSNTDQYNSIANAYREGSLVQKMCSGIVTLDNLTDISVLMKMLGRRLSLYARALKKIPGMNK